VSVQTHEQVFDVIHVAGDVAVKGHENFAQKKKTLMQMA
jgi:hypothetical protein